ncbi:hypothetical protein CCMA1212_005011 [Trichoderma ghanense]|uniref:Uncharacterized protein n=1 Tax=Trichoderma ghanense TaxID=65468 RepID=A0ABY2H3P2_9HYPO
MSWKKDRFTEEMEEERRNLDEALDDVEAFGEKFECPSEYCDSKVCSKSFVQCSLGYCTRWPLNVNCMCAFLDSTVVNPFY